MGVLEVLGASDEVLPLVSAALCSRPEAGPPLPSAPGVPAPLNSAPEVLLPPPAADAPAEPVRQLTADLVPQLPGGNGSPSLVGAEAQPQCAAENMGSEDRGGGLGEGVACLLEGIEGASVEEPVGGRAGGQAAVQGEAVGGCTDMPSHGLQGRDGAPLGQASGSLERANGEHVAEGAAITTSLRGSEGNSSRVEKGPGNARLAACVRPNQTMGLV